jgi:NADPH:quinone reductase-like Zn-dependent oxidoreductase
MKAIFFEQHGGIEVLKYGDIPTPVPSPTEALIKVSLVALNHLDIWVRRGWEGLSLETPHISGSDIVGTIVESGSDIAWPKGTRVVVNPGFITGQDEWTRRGEASVSPYYKILGEHRRGGLAEYVTVPLENLYRVPSHISDEEAVTIPLVGTTVWRMLFHRAYLKAGETVLIVGSGGGVNALSIMVTKSVGAKAIVLAGSAEKASRATDLGADLTIDYNAIRSWQQEVLLVTKGRGADLVIDNVGSATMAKSLRSVRRGGRIVTVGNTSGHEIVIDNRLLFAKQVSLIGSTMGSDQDFVDAMSYLWTLPLKKLIDSVVPLSDGIAAIARLERGEHYGKILLRP